MESPDNHKEEIEARRSALIKELTDESNKRNKAAHWDERLASTLFYASLVFGGAAVAAGLIKALKIPPEVISLLAAVGTGATFVSREAKYRAKAEWHFVMRDIARQLVARLEYEMPIPVTREDVAGVSQEWRRRRAELGQQMAAIQGATRPSRSRPPSTEHKS